MRSSPLHTQISYGWFVLAACFFVLFVSMGARNGLGVFVIPMSEDFEWSRATFSLAMAVGWLANGVSQPLIGRIYDRYGARRVISISMVIVGAASMLLAVIDSLWQLILLYGIVISVVSGGASLVTVHAVLAKWFYRRRGIAMSISTAGASAGALVLTPFTAYLIQLVDWRPTWVVLGGIVLALGVPLALLLIRTIPRTWARRPMAHRRRAPGRGQQPRVPRVRWKQTTGASRTGPRPCGSSAAPTSSAA